MYILINIISHIHTYTHIYPIRRLFRGHLGDYIMPGRGPEPQSSR